LKTVVPQQEQRSYSKMNSDYKIGVFVYDPIYPVLVVSPTYL